MSWTKDYLRAKIFLSRKKFDFTMEMLFIVTLFTAIAKTRFSGLKRSSATILFHTYRKFDVNLPKTPSFRKKNASFIENNLPFVDIMFLSRKEAKGSTFRCLAIPDLQGNDIIAITNSQANKMTKAHENGKGIMIRMSSSQLKHNTKIEGGFLGLLAGLAARALPMLAKTVLPALGVGALSGLASSGMQKAMGSAPLP